MRVSLQLIVFLFVMTISVGCKFEPTIVEWKDGVIPYYLSGDFTDTEKQLIEEGMRLWEQKADVTFREVSPRAGAYKIIRIHASHWSSSIGENNSECHMYFGDDSDPLPHIIHELGHTLGLLHEHQRPDRDLYIVVNWVNIIAKYDDAFEIRDNPLINEEAFPYDFHSIMHYPSDAYSINGEKTLESRIPGSPIDRLGIITDTDAAKVVEIYGPPNEE